MKINKYQSADISVAVNEAIRGEREALEYLLFEIKDFVFNLSLRMLGSIADAEDASQEILIKVMTKLSSFQQKAHFNTWVYRIASNHLIDYQKSMFAHHQLDFQIYEQDIRSTLDQEPVSGEIAVSAVEELKLSCTNVMLQCFPPQDRCIFILGTMFQMKSAYASEILGISAVSYRKRLSRNRQKMQAFLMQNCGLSETGVCQCEKRVSYACEQGRIDQKNLQFGKLKPINHLLLSEYVATMEALDEQIEVFGNLPNYAAGLNEKLFLEQLIATHDFNKIVAFDGGGRDV